MDRAVSWVWSEMHQGGGMGEEEKEECQRKEWDWERVTEGEEMWMVPHQAPQPIKVGGNRSPRADWSHTREMSHVSLSLLSFPHCLSTVGQSYHSTLPAQSCLPHIPPPPPHFLSFPSLVTCPSLLHSVCRWD